MASPPTTSPAPADSGLPVNPPVTQPIRLEIAPIVDQAEEIHARVRRELPTHPGLARLAWATARAAEEAARISTSLRRPWGWHRLPAMFLGLALLLLLWWLYSEFGRSTTLTVALPDRDAHRLRERIRGDRRVRFRLQTVSDSFDSVRQVDAGIVDLGYWQGGIDLPEDLPRVMAPDPELILWLVRRGKPLDDIETILTSTRNAGSHTVAEKLFSVWWPRHTPRFVHEWRELAQEANYRVPAEIDAVFVVKDPEDEETLRAVSRLAAAGFELVSLDLGARERRVDYLVRQELRPGFLQSLPAVPETTITTYQVATWLVGRRGLTPARLHTAGELLHPTTPLLQTDGLAEGLNDASELFQGIEAFLGILINIGLAFLALLGWEMLAYRRQFHDLNSLISLISVHQSSKDVLGVSNPRVIRENLAYLSYCSDLLGLISMIAGYSTQENASLMFNSLPENVHSRCDGLKINIQLKILHATIPVEWIPAPTMVPPTAPGDSPLPSNRLSNTEPAAPESRSV
ncbi:MAG: hypothetical protein ACK5EA_23430 [Planctomycetaceae bacterium]